MTLRKLRLIAQTELKKKCVNLLDGYKEKYIHGLK